MGDFIITMYLGDQVVVVSDQGRELASLVQTGAQQTGDLFFVVKICQNRQNFQKCLAPQVGAYLTLHVDSKRLIIYIAKSDHQPA